MSRETVAYSPVISRSPPAPAAPSAARRGRAAASATPPSEGSAGSILQPGRNWSRELAERAATSALLAVRTSSYASRPWCQREMLLAKTAGMPIVVLDALEHPEERGSFLMDHVPRVPVLETAQAFLGSRTPVMMDIATAANFPCQRPFSEHLGVAELPQYRILPNFKQVVVSSNKWQSAEDGGPFLFIQALLRTSSVPTYLRDDWYRDWGSIERYDRVVPASAAPNAVIDQGSQRVFGWSRSGPIRALP